MDGSTVPPAVAFLGHVGRGPTVDRCTGTDGNEDKPEAACRAYACMRAMMPLSPRVVPLPRMPPTSKACQREGSLLPMRRAG